MDAVLQLFWRQLGASWGRLGAILGPCWGRLGAILGPSWGHLGAFLGQLGAILGPLGAILGPSWGHLPALKRQPRKEPKMRLGPPPQKSPKTSKPLETFDETALRQRLRIWSCFGLLLRFPREGGRGEGEIHCQENALHATAQGTWAGEFTVLFVQLVLCHYVCLQSIRLNSFRPLLQWVNPPLER